MKQTAGVGEAQPEIASRREGPEPPELKTVKVPEIQVSDWTPESVVNTAFSFVNAIFQEAKLSDEGQKKACRAAHRQTQRICSWEFPPSRRDCTKRRKNLRTKGKG